MIGFNPAAQPLAFPVWMPYKWLVLLLPGIRSHLLDTESELQTTMHPLIFGFFLPVALCGVLPASVPARLPDQSQCILHADTVCGGAGCASCCEGGMWAMCLEDGQNEIGWCSDGQICQAGCYEYSDLSDSPCVNAS